MEVARGADWIRHVDLDMPRLLDSLTDVSPEQSAIEPLDSLDGYLGETGSGEPIGDDEL